MLQIDAIEKVCKFKNKISYMVEKYMKLALAEAQKASLLGEVPVGAVIVVADRVIARTHNLCETLSDPTAHAEMQAITIACNEIGSKYLNECTIYVTVEPCPMCAAAMYWSQIGKVVYGASDTKRGYTTISDSLMHPKCEVVSGILADECSSIMTDFFKKLRK